jgi:hypothetical protein
VQPVPEAPHGRAEMVDSVQHPPAHSRTGAPAHP